MRPDVPRGSVIQSEIPGRLDALGWSSWHRRVIVALGITWILDGLEASLIANLAPTLQDPRALGLRAAQLGLVNSAYLFGQVGGALLFGHLTDRFGRKRLFLLTLGLYLGATAASGAAPSFAVFALFRLLAGAGIGGEYAAINSAIDELVPARIRGQVDLAINGSYWLGVALGAGLSVLFLNPRFLPIALGWRLVFGLGALLGGVILLIRRDVPESPRWLLMHGYLREANQTMASIERAAKREEPTAPKVEALSTIAITVTGVASWSHITRTLLRRYPRRTALGVTLMIAQAFFYNAIFFSYGLILQRFHGVRADRVGLYILPFAAGNFLGPLVLGPLFDRWGRRTMIPLTYAISGISLLAGGCLFYAGLLDAITQTLTWCVVFFFASSAASSAYLTVSELFPVEIRGIAIAIFYAIGTGAGAFAPSLFGWIVEGGAAARLFAGYGFASSLMLVAAGVARKLSIASEGKSLESLASDDTHYT
jgi:MFS family permease